MLIASTISKPEDRATYKRILDRAECR